MYLLMAVMIVTGLVILERYQKFIKDFEFNQFLENHYYKEPSEDIPNN